MSKLLGLIFVLFSLNSIALERKDIMDVSINDITSDTQAQPAGSGDKHLSFVWWVPFEYWQSVFSRDPNISEPAKEDMLKILKQYTVIGVVQADVSPVGAFDFYNKKHVLDNLTVTYQNNNLKPVSLAPEKNINADMQLLMDQTVPILKAAMGNMGANFHFYIYSDKNNNGERLINPYKQGELNINLLNNEGKNLQVEFNTPLNSLYISRTCPNGENAHISWNYCPWSGKKL